VPLACTEPAQLASPACVDDELILVTAVVRDLEASAVLDADQASSVTVSVVEPIAAQDDDGDTIVTVPAGDTIRLRPGLVGSPTFFAQVRSSLVGDTMCTLVVELAPQVTTAVVCERGTEIDGNRDIGGALVPRNTL